MRHCRREVRIIDRFSVVGKIKLRLGTQVNGNVLTKPSAQIGFISLRLVENLSHALVNTWVQSSNRVNRVDENKGAAVG